MARRANTPVAERREFHEGDEFRFPSVLAALSIVAAAHGDGAGSPGPGISVLSPRARESDCPSRAA